MTEASAPSRQRPPPWTFLAAAAAIFVGCIGLGVWQLDRLGWKIDLNSRLADRLDSPPIDLATALSDPAAAEFRPIRLTGRFDHGAEMQVGARTVDGIGGVDVMTPLILASGPWAGRRVLVLRGWIPLDRRDPATRPDSQPNGPVAIAGWVRRPTSAHGFGDLFLPDDRPDEAYWVRIDLATMADHAGLEGAPPIFVQAGPDTGEARGRTALPVGRRPEAHRNNPHLSYALTWFGLAAGILAMTVLLVRRWTVPASED